MLKCKEAFQAVTAYQAELRRLGKLPQINEVQKPKESRFAGMRIADAACQIFMEANKTVLTTREILNALTRSGFQINARFPTASINSALKREPDKFEKIGRGTFKLKEKLFNKEFILLNKENAPALYNR